MNFIFLKRKNLTLLLFIFSISSLVFLLSSCANIGSPSGGKKDTEPPQAIKEIPPNKSVRFNAKNISITFNEFVQLNDVANQVLISPAFSEIPEIKLKRKNIILPIKDSLRANTTYTINFGNSIKDVHEGNTMEDYKYVFSTGDYLDSLKITGKVFFANNKKTEKGILVMLYDKSEDSIPMKEKPVYFSKTDENGNFKIENIKEGIYKLFALKDMNFNMLYDLPNEQIAFLDSGIIVDSVEKNYELAMFGEDKIQQKLLNVYSKNFGRVNFAFSKPTLEIPKNEVEIIPQIKSQQFENEKWESSKNNDTITYWFSDVHLDSLSFFVNIGKDSVWHHDTVVVKIPGVSKDSSVKEILNMMLAKNTGRLMSVPNTQDLNQPLKIDFNHPIMKSDFEKMILLEDSQLVKNLSCEFINKINRKVEIKYSWKDTTQYTLVIPNNTFSDIFGLTNDSIIFKFKTKSTADYGNLEIKISKFDSAKYFMEFSDEKENLMEKIMISKERESKINFKLLPPAKYQIKFTKDENGNNKWDAGDYLKKIQPEKVIYYKEPINLRANWDMEIEITIGQ